MFVKEETDWRTAMKRRSPRLSPKMRTVFDTNVWSVLTPAMTWASSSWSLRLGFSRTFSGSTATWMAGSKGRDPSGRHG